MIIVDNSGNRKVLKVKDRTVKHFKVNVNLGKLIGTEFGMHHQVRDSKTGYIEKITDVRLFTKAFLEEEDDADEEEELKEALPTKDNRDINDNNQAQKLTQLQIEEMKASGLTGGELITQLVLNSDTYN